MITWIKKNNYTSTTGGSPTQIPVPRPNALKNLNAANIVIDLATTSLKILSTSGIIGGFSLAALVTTGRSNRTISLYFDDEEPLFLEFTSLAEATLFETNLITALNGGIF